MATMEDLTKTQIVLLTLLISFITSIATGIITTSLLAEAPAGVTQTINRVVERTIEKVAPTATSTQAVKEVTVVKEDDAILSAVDAASQSVVSIEVRGGDGNPMFYGLGAIVTKDGYVVSDGQGLILDGSYTAVLGDGTHIPAAVVSRSKDQNLATFKLTSGDPKKTYTPITLAQDDLKLGQTVIAFEGQTNIGIAVGRVKNLLGRNESAKTVVSVTTDLAAAGETAGAPLIDLSGELVGIKSSNADLTLPAGAYTAITPIRTQISAPVIR